MKKMIALLLALIMVFSLVACSGSADTAKDTTTTDSTTTDTADTTGGMMLTEMLATIPRNKANSLPFRGSFM